MKFLCVKTFRWSGYITPVAPTGWPKNAIPCMILRITLHVNQKCIKLRAVSLPSLSYLFVLLLSRRFKSGDFVFMQDSADRAKATWYDLWNVVHDLAVEKTSGSTAAVTKQDEDQFIAFSVERFLRLLQTLLCFFTFWRVRLLCLVSQLE